MVICRHARYVAVAAVLTIVPSAAAQPAAATSTRGELVERTMAIVAGSAITLTDVRTAMALGFVDSGDDISAATERLVKRALMLREVDRYAPQEPDAVRVEDRIRHLRERLGEATLAAILAGGGFGETKLRTWIRDDVRIAAYLDQRFATDGPERRQGLIDDWVADLWRRTPVVELWRR
jgi:hypothetical protein